MSATDWRAPGTGSPVRELLTELLVAGRLTRDVYLTPDVAHAPTDLLILKRGEFEPLDVERAAEALGRVGVSVSL